MEQSGEKNEDVISHAYLVDAKTQYTESLIDCLVPRLYEGFLELFQAAKERADDENEVILTFQQMLKAIPNWNQNIIDEEYGRIMEGSNCKDYFDDLLSAIFLVTIKILTHVQFANSKSNLDVEIPNSKAFVHGTYINSARQIYNNPYLFDDRDERVSAFNQKKNYCDAIDMIKESIRETLRKSIPVQDIVHHSLLQEDDENDISELNNVKNDVQKKIQAKMLQAKVEEFKLKAMQEMNLDEDEYKRMVSKQFGGGNSTSDEDEDVNDNDFSAFNEDHDNSDDDDEEDRNINIYPHSKNEAQQFKSLKLFETENQTPTPVQNPIPNPNQQTTSNNTQVQENITAHTSNGQNISIPTEITQPSNPNVHTAPVINNPTNPFNVPKPESINPNQRNNITQNFDNTGNNCNGNENANNVNFFEDADYADSD